MPALDMPLEQMINYTGSSPCPADIDSYWEEALAEMNAVEPKAEFVEKKFTATDGTNYSYATYKKEGAFF